MTAFEFEDVFAFFNVTYLISKEQIILTGQMLNFVSWMFKMLVQRKIVDTIWAEKWIVPLTCIVILHLNRYSGSKKFKKWEDLSRIFGEKSVSLHTDQINVEGFIFILFYYCKPKYSSKNF